MMFTISSHFIAIFKVGDNINHSLKILEFLYRSFDGGNANEKKLLCKPITIELTSIIEAVLHDFVERIQKNTIEGVVNISIEAINKIRNKEYDKFAHYIALSKKYELFGTNLNFYDDLEKLRKIRNRVHIQNADGHRPLNQNDVFGLDEKTLAEKSLEHVLKILAVKYPRVSALHHVDNFDCPWTQHAP